MQSIQEEAATRIGVATVVFLQPGRATARVSYMRDAAMLAAYRLYPQPSTREIGEAFGGRTSGVVSAALRRALRAEKRDTAYAALVRDLHGTASA